ncbi:hypothetical protein QQZ08_006978 [Neonectria magnoliae]|uniref:Uncharacterized protein n=1 Tax=Neonectria magnoliae TaxID=2732573 RepID=A0ABR1HZ64_9HYPO
MPLMTPALASREISKGSDILRCLTLALSYRATVSTIPVPYHDKGHIAVTEYVMVAEFYLGGPDAFSRPTVRRMFVEMWSRQLQLIGGIAWCAGDPFKGGWWVFCAGVGGSGGAFRGHLFQRCGALPPRFWG